MLFDNVKKDTDSNITPDTYQLISDYTDSIELDGLGDIDAIAENVSEEIYDYIKISLREGTDMYATFAFVYYDFCMYHGEFMDTIREFVKDKMEEKRKEIYLYVICTRDGSTAYYMAEDLDSTIWVNNGMGECPHHNGKLNKMYKIEASSEDEAMEKMSKKALKVLNEHNNNELQYFYPECETEGCDG